MSEPRFHYSSTPPSPQFIADLQLLSSLDSDAFAALGEVVLSFLRHSADQEDVLQQFQQKYPQMKSKAKSVLTSLLHFFSLSIQSFGAQHVSTHQQQQNVIADLTRLGLSQDKAELLAGKFLADLTQFYDAAIDKTLHVNQLFDIQWKFGVTAASSEVNQMGACFLQLQMTVEKGQGKENVLMGQQTSTHQHDVR